VRWLTFRRDGVRAGWRRAARFVIREQKIDANRVTLAITRPFAKRPPSTLMWIDAMRLLQNAANASNIAIGDAADPSPVLGPPKSPVR
jgi:hypothetical protein